VQIRLIQGAQEAQHIFTMNGVKWHRLPGSNADKDANDLGFVNTQTLGISEHFEFDVNVSPFNGSHTDYLYFGSSIDQLWDGLWGVLRSFPPPREQSVTSKVTTSTGPVQFTPSEFLTPIQPPPPVRLGDIRNVCPEVRGDKAKRQHRNFDVSAVKVCDLFNNCGSASPGAIEYSSRYGIRMRRRSFMFWKRRPSAARTRIRAMFTPLNGSGVRTQQRCSNSGPNSRSAGH
jgi:hypothetical protein